MEAAAGQVQRSWDPPTSFHLRPASEGAKAFRAEDEVTRATEQEDRSIWARRQLRPLMQEEMLAAMVS